MMDTKEILKELTDSYCVGIITDTREIIKKHLSFCDICEDIGSCGVYAKLDKGKEKTLLIDAHIDEIAMVVTDISDDGFLTVKNVGGIDLRTLPAKEVVIHGKKKIPAVFSSTPPHLLKEEQKFNDISSMKIDTGLKNAGEIISIGDFVTFKNEFLELNKTRVCAKSLDDRAGCALLLLLAERLKDKELDYNIIFLFSDGEEIGLRGAKTASFALSPDMAIAIDVTFAHSPEVPQEHRGKLGHGARITISPVLDKALTNELFNTAKENQIPYQSEVCAIGTGTNADAISITKEGIPTALISLPLRNMHTDCEIIDINDIENTVTLLEKYICKGGLINA